MPEQLYIMIYIPIYTCALKTIAQFIIDKKLVSGMKVISPIKF